MANNKVEYTIELNDQVSSAIKKMQENAGKAFENLKKSVGTVSNSINGLGAAIASVASVSAIKSISQTAEEVDAIKFSLTSYFGENFSKKAFEEIKNLERATGLSKDFLKDQAILLKKFGFDASQITSTLSSIADISLGDSSSFASITQALASISARGYATRETLVALGVQGFDPLSSIAKKTGKSLGDMLRLVDQGQVSFSEISEEIKAATKSGGNFAGVAEKMQDNVSGRIKRLSVDFSNLSATIGQEIQKNVIEKISFFEKLTKKIEENKEVIGKVAPIIVEFASNVFLATAAVKGLNLVMSINPYVALAGALIGIVTLLQQSIDYTKEFEKVTNSFETGGFFAAMTTIGETIQKSLRKIGDWILEGVFKIFLTIGSAITSIFPDSFGIDFRRKIDSAYKYVDEYFSSKEKEKSTPMAQIPKASIETTSAILRQEAQGLTQGGLIQSGGIKQFNINIQTLNGIGTANVTSGDIEEIAKQVEVALVRQVSQFSF